MVFNTLTNIIKPNNENYILKNPCGLQPENDVYNFEWMPGLMPLWS